MGIKLLSLQSAASLARAEPPQPGPSLPASATLREAVSALVLHGAEALNLLDDDGTFTSMLHAADLFRDNRADEPLQTAAEVGHG